MSRREKPPVGPKPRRLFLESRADELAFALSGWTDYMKQEPTEVRELGMMVEWSNELSDRLEELQGERVADPDYRDPEPWGEAVRLPTELQVPAWQPDPPLVPDAPRVPPEPVE